MVTTTKDSWLPGIPKFEDWETNNRLGGMKVIIQHQIVHVERHFHHIIRANLTGYPNANAIAISCLETSLGFLNTTSNFITDTYRDLEVAGFPAQITWQLVSKL
eukprot:1295680-Ditylum_brightwellii.AAC.1